MFFVNEKVRFLRKLKKYIPTKFKAEDSIYDKDAADFAVMLDRKSVV